MVELLGFQITRNNDKEKPAEAKQAFTVPSPDDGTTTISAGGYFGQYLDMEVNAKNDIDLIKRYREMSLHPEVDSAIEDIVNEAIVSDTNDSPVEIELSNLNASDGIKTKIRKEFKHILDLLDFDKKSHEIYRNWYIDGRIYYHKIIDLKNPQEGIKELRYIDAMKMRYIRQQKKKPGETQNLNNQLRGWSALQDILQV